MKDNLWVGSCRKRDGFTLIELLVTIGTIVVLAALVIGSVRKIKESALRAGCASNLKTIGVAATQYAQDHNGSYPYTYDLVLGINNSLSPGLIDLLGEYLNGDYRPFYCPDAIHCMAPPALATDLTYQAQAARSGTARFRVIGYNWTVSTSKQWPAKPQKTAGSGMRILATCRAFGGAVTHNRVHNLLHADGHIDARRADSNGVLLNHVNVDTLILDPTFNP